MTKRQMQERIDDLERRVRDLESAPRYYPPVILPTPQPPQWSWPFPTLPTIDTPPWPQTLPPIIDAAPWLTTITPLS